MVPVKMDSRQQRRGVFDSMKNRLAQKKTEVKKDFDAIEQLKKDAGMAKKRQFYATLEPDQMSQESVILK
jgi:hypothetical protein